MTRNTRAAGAFSSLAAGDSSAWVLVSGSAQKATWDADFAGNQYYRDSTVYITIAAFFSAFGATFTRGSGGTFVGSNGLVQTEGSNDVPRLNFTPGGTQTALGLMMEGAATNYALQSEDMDTTWAGHNGGCTITINDTTAPDGTTTADKVFQIDSTGDALKQTVTVANLSTMLTISGFFKNVDATTSRLRFQKDTETNAELEFRWTGATPSTESSVEATNITYTEYDDNWWRISYTTLSDSVNLNTHLLLVGPEHFDAPGTPQGIHCWGIEVKEEPFLSSYIKTTTIAVTRFAEACVSTFADAPDIPFKDWSTTVGTMYAKWVPSDVVETPLKNVFLIQDAGDDEDESVLIRASEDDVLAGTTDGGTGSLMTFTTTLTKDTSVQAATSWLVNNTAAVVNGGIVGTDDVATIPVCTRMFFGDSSGGDETLNGHITRLAYWNLTLSDADLDTITGG